MKEDIRMGTSENVIKNTVKMDKNLKILKKQSKTLTTLNNFSCLLVLFVFLFVILSESCCILIAYSVITTLFLIFHIFMSNKQRRLNIETLSSYSRCIEEWGEFLSRIKESKNKK